MKLNRQFYDQITADGFVWLREELTVIEASIRARKEKIVTLELILKSRNATPVQKYLTPALLHEYKEELYYLQAHRIGLMKRLGWG